MKNGKAILLEEFSKNIPQIFWKSDLDFKKFYYVSPTYEVVWGKNLKDLYNNPKDWFNSIVPDDQKRVLDSFKTLSEENPTRSIEYTIKRPDGYYRHILDTRSFSKGDDNNSACLIGVATDITRQKNFEKRIELQHIITKTMSETKNVEPAMSKIIKLITKKLDFNFGALWIPTNDHQAMHCSFCFVEDPKFKSFEQISYATPVPIGIVLPGRVFETKQPAWIEDMLTEENFSRSAVAKSVGLKGACAFPIIADTEVLGVMEFFSIDYLHVDRDLLNILNNIAEQMGQFIRRKQAEAKLDHMAYHDTLTGLANRTLLINIIDRAIDKARKRDEKVAVLFLDLDRFKHINDNFGHEVGDAFLKTVSNRLLSKVRKQDTVARIGGDEFVIILSEIKYFETVSVVAQKILEILSQPFNIKGQDYFITTSIGISLFPNDGQESKVLLGKADIAMYQAKNLGGNNFQYCTKEMTEIAQEKATLEIDLHSALKNNEFVMLYQPKIDINARQIVGVESLLYWNRNGTLVGPKHFLPFAEETGLIVPIGDWTLKTACTQGKVWEDMGFSITIAVNLSQRQFLYEKLLETIHSTLLETGLSEGMLEVEITESMLMKKTEESIALIRALQNNNIKIAFDDFGTGYSSLMYLKRFSVDRLKIDQSFIQGISTAPSDRAITRTIIALAHSMGIKVIAEGVETLEQYKFLKTHRCDEIQGFYFSKPLSAKEMTQYLLNNNLNELLI